MFNAYEIAKQLMLTRHHELIDILDELAINWPNSYRRFIETVKDNAQWHLEED